MVNEEFDENLDEKSKNYRRMKSIIDYGMGILWLVMGIFFLMPAKFSMRFAQYDNGLMKSFAGICILYGAFRIYRGYKKSYYK